MTSRRASRPSRRRLAAASRRCSCQGATTAKVAPSPTPKLRPSLPPREPPPLPVASSRSARRRQAIDPAPGAAVSPHRHDPAEPALVNMPPFVRSPLPTAAPAGAVDGWDDDAPLQATGAPEVDPTPRRLRKPRGPGILRKLLRPGRRETPATEAESDEFGGAGVLAVRGLQKSYGGRTVVHDAALHVRNGEAVGLLGPN